LSDLGRQQARALRQRLAQRSDLDSIAAVYTSRLRRAIETAEMLLPALPRVEVVQDCRLCEIHEPGLDGLPHRPRAHWWNEVGFRRPSSPGAESYETFCDRATSAVRDIVERHRGGVVLVVTHAGVIRAAMATLGGAPLGEGFYLRPRNASVNEFVYDPVGFRPFEWALDRYNDTAHLDAL
jgi:broad specificity phosphatase PhoE